MKKYISIMRMLKKALHWIDSNKYKIGNACICIIIFVLTILTQPISKNNEELECFANNKQQIESSNYIYNRESINNFILLAKAYEWKLASSLIKDGEAFTVIDIKTGRSVNMQRTGGHRHYDVETVSKKDTEELRDIWRGFNWSRRGVLILHNNNVYIASMHGMPHAGLDKYPAKTYIPFRSSGYGAGINYDVIKGNGMDGHVCIHFINSTTHGSKKIDGLHQEEIRKILEIQKSFYEE